LARIDAQNQDRIIEAIRALAHTPRPHGVKKLSGREAWRIRLGDYRVIYEIHDDQLVITVVAIGHRREVYQ
jgi:mRNA interferase RelE/StbE